MPRYRVVEVVEAIRVFTITSNNEQLAAEMTGTDVVEEPVTTMEPTRNLSVTLVEPEAKP